MFHRRSVCVIVTVFISIKAAQPTLIDNFLPINHSADMTFQGEGYGGRSLVGAFQGNMIGGERDVELSQDTDTSFPYATTFARYSRNPEYRGEEFFQVGGIGPMNGANTTTATVVLQYDRVGDELGNIGLDKRLRNGGTGAPLLLGNDGGIRVWYNTQSSRRIPITTVLRQQGVEIGRFEVTTSLPRQFTPLLFPFAPEVLGNADSISIEFRPLLSGNATTAIWISHIDTILPEPGAWLAMGTGLGVLALKLRKRSA